MSHWEKPMHITYLFDPLCGWCYGAGPAMDHLSDLPDVRLELAPSGLFIGDDRRMEPGMAQYILEADARIARMTGQVFSDAYRADVLGEAGGVMDSGAATLGVLAAGLEDRAQELPALKAIQQVRYIGGRNNSYAEIVADALADAGFQQAAQAVRQPDQTLLDALRVRVTEARRAMARFGIRGVPALLAGQGADQKVLPSGILFGDRAALQEEIRAA